MVSTDEHLNLKNLDQVRVLVQVVTGGTPTHSLVPPPPPLHRFGWLHSG